MVRRFTRRLFVKIDSAFKHAVPRIRDGEIFNGREIFSGEIFHKNIFALNNFRFIIAEIKINLQGVGIFRQIICNGGADVGLISPIVKIARGKEPIDRIAAHFFCQNAGAEREARTIRRGIPTAVTLQFEQQIFFAKLIHQKIIGAVRSDNISDADRQILINGIFNHCGKFFSVAREIFLLLLSQNLRRERIMQFVSFAFREQNRRVRDWERTLRPRLKFRRELNCQFPRRNNAE